MDDGRGKKTKYDNAKKVYEKEHYIILQVKDAFICITTFSGSLNKCAISVVLMFCQQSQNK